MERLIVDCFDEVAEMMFDDVMTDASSVSFVGLYDDAATVLKALLNYDITTAYQIEIEPEDWDGYDKEWLITLDGDFNVWCEKLYRNTGYIGFEDTVAYFADECNSACLKKAWCKVGYVVGLDDEPLCSTEHSTVVRNDDGRMVGVTKSWMDQANGYSYYHSMSHYSSDEACVKEAATKFGVKF